MNIDSVEHVSWIPFEAEMKHVFCFLFHVFYVARATESLKKDLKKKKKKYKIGDKPIHVFLKKREIRQLMHTFQNTRAFLLSDVIAI